jgi:hypothetical protein
MSGLPLCRTLPVIPAKAGISGDEGIISFPEAPACAGVTE